MEATKDDIPLWQNLNTKNFVLETIFKKFEKSIIYFQIHDNMFFKKKIKETTRLETFKLKHISTFSKVQFNVKL